MMSRLLHYLPRGLRHPKTQGNSASPWCQPCLGQDENRQQAGVINDADAYKSSAGQLPLNIRHYHTLTKPGGWKGFVDRMKWGSFKYNGSKQTAEDAWEWGTAVFLGVHLCRTISAATLPNDSRGKKRGLLSSLADKPSVLPSNIVGPLHLVSQENENKIKTVADDGAESKSTELTPLATAVNRLVEVRDCTMGQLHNGLGMKEARQGRYKQAADHFREGSRVGFSRATFNLAVCHEQGRGVTQDLEKAGFLYKAAAMQGHPLASFNLGLFHLKGIGGVQCSAKLALELMSTAAAAGVTEANSYLGVHFLKNSKDAQKAVTYLQRAVSNQDTEAEYHLGLCHEEGHGVAVDITKAVQLYHKAAKKGHAEALYRLARFNEHGLGGLPINRVKALQLYKEASHRGHQEASQHLREMELNPAAATTTNPIISNGEHAHEKASCNPTVVKAVGTSKKHDEPRTVHKSQDPQRNDTHSTGFHGSVSAPSLGISRKDESNISTKASTNQNMTYVNGKLSMSHLSLLLPYYLHLSFRPPVSTSVSEDQGSPNVSFQIGDDEETVDRGALIEVC